MACIFIRPVLRVSLILLILSETLSVAAEEGERMVQTYCATCHSLALVYAQSGNERFWRTTINAMRESGSIRKRCWGYRKSS